MGNTPRGDGPAQGVRSARGARPPTVTAAGESPRRRRVEARGGGVPLDAAEAELFRSTAARANYLALDRPDVAFAAKELCRRMSAPRQQDRQALRRLCRYLLGAPRVVYHFARQEVARPLQVFADTDFAGCVHTRRSTSGGCALRGGHLLKHWSTTQKAITLSSGEAELGGVVKAAAEGIGLQSLARDLGVELALELFADSSAAIGICRRSGIGRVRHLAVGQLWVQEKLRGGQFSLYKVLGTRNPADLCTKHLPAEGVGTHLQTLHLASEEGRATSAPRVTAEISACLLYTSPSPRDS